jgi:3-hydroxybutyryl-CoA dehydrogenase
MPMADIRQAEMIGLKRIAIIGAGLMGHGIAQVFAAAGNSVRIFDPHPETLASVLQRIRSNLKDLGQDPAIADRVETRSEIPAAVQDANFVVEAAVENLEAKQQIFAEIEAVVSSDTILASNTSVIPITAIMGKLKHKERALGTHWWNPPFLVPLVEVIGTQWTDARVLEETIALHKAIGKTPVHVKKDVAGFVGNRLQHALWREAISLVERGICDAATVDTVVKASFGRRLPVLGPLENADLVGTDLTLAIHNIVLSEIESSTRPSPYLESLVSEKKLGFKSGEGFQRWTPQQQAALRARVVNHLKQAQTNDA